MWLRELGAGGGSTPRGVSEFGAGDAKRPSAWNASRAPASSWVICHSYVLVCFNEVLGFKIVLNGLHYITPERHNFVP